MQELFDAFASSMISSKFKPIEGKSPAIVEIRAKLALETNPTIEQISKFKPIALVDPNEVPSMPINQEKDSDSTGILENLAKPRNEDTEGKSEPKPFSFSIKKGKSKPTQFKIELKPSVPVDVPSKSLAQDVHVTTIQSVSRKETKEDEILELQEILDCDLNEEILEPDEELDGVSYVESENEHDHMTDETFESSESESDGGPVDSETPSIPSKVTFPPKDQSEDSDIDMFA